MIHKGEQIQMNMKKRTLALILTLTMLFSMAVTAIAEGVGAGADEEDTTAPAETQSAVTETVTEETTTDTVTEEDTTEAVTEEDTTAAVTEEETSDAESETEPGAESGAASETEASPEASEDLSDTTEETEIPPVQPDPVQNEEQDEQAEPVTPDISGILENNQIYFPAVNFTNAAPLMQFPSMLTMSGMFSAFSLADTEAANETIDAPVELSKTVSETADEDGNYTLTLESYATGKTVTTQTYEEKPADIVLVLDYSSSMLYCSDPKCNQSLDAEGGSDLIFGARLNGTSKEVFIIHEYVFTNHISKNDGKYRVNAADVVANGTYYVRFKTVENNKVYAKAHYCQECTVMKNDGKTYWHLADHLAEHEKPFCPGDVVSATVNANGSPLFLQIPEEDLDDICCVSRYRMMYEALQAFMDDLVKRAKGSDGIGGTEDDVNHRVSISKFSTIEKKLFSLTPVLDDEGKLSKTIQDGVNEYKFNDGTATDGGLEQGVLEFKNLGAIDSTRSRLLILLTDGVPTGTTNGGTAGRVGPSLKYTYDAINTYQASVYTIGIFQGADASDKQTITTFRAADFDSALNTEQQIATINSFMKLLSSNYPNISTVNQWLNRDIAALTLNPNLAADRSYYLSAADIDSLKDAFLQIAAGVGSETVASDLDQTAVVRDVVTKYFEVPAGSEIKAYTMTYGGKESETGNDIWSHGENELTGTLTVTAGQTSTGNLTLEMQENTDGTTTVNVSNFNFGENYVGIDENIDGETVTFTPHGKKLVIEIKVKPKSGFLGGNQVPTNTADSGIYDKDGNLLEEFPVPETDIKLTVKDVIITNQFSFLGANVLDDITVSDFDGFVSIWIGDNPIALKLNETDWGLTWEKDYIDICVELIDEKGNSLPDGIVRITEDTKFKVRVTFRPKYTGNYQLDVDSEEGTIHVFYPELTFKDSKDFFYGDAVPASNVLQNLSGEPRWWRKENDQIIYYDNSPGTGTVGFSMLGTAPTDFAYTCTPDASGTLPKSDVPVNVTVTQIGTISGENLNEYVRFSWNACHDGCGTPIAGHAGDDTSSPEFYIHPKTCTLTIEKSGGDANEPYIFTILKGGVKYSEASLLGEGSKTISELPVGIYTIQENEKWSWRYSGDNDSAVTLNAANPTGKITCENKQTENKWLNGFSEVVKNVFGVPRSSGNAS